MVALNQFNISSVKGALDLKFNANTISAIVDSSESGTLVPGQAVTLVDSAGGVPKVIAATADTDTVFGFVNYGIKDASFAAGDALEISLTGNVMYMEAGAAVARGAILMPVISGQKVITATVGTKCIVGKALDKAGASGDLIRVYIKSFADASFTAAS